MARMSLPPNPLRPISFTASETIARRIVERLHQRPPFELSWTEYAVQEIARALAAAMVRPKN
jgi:hypothetical protein